MICALNIDGNIEIHIAGDSGGGYDTICGIDACDDSVGHYGYVELPPKAKITCMSCYNLWKQIKEAKLKNSDFVMGAK